MWLAEDGWVFLHSGRLLPSSEEAGQCGEGVGILLSPGVNAWHTVGYVLSTASSRIVAAQLKLASVGLRQARGGRCSSDIYLTVISAYVPTFTVPSDIKEPFWNNLQRYLAAVPDSDKLLIEWVIVRVMMMWCVRLLWSGCE